MRRYRYKATRRWQNRTGEEPGALGARRILLDRLSRRTIINHPHRHSTAYLAFVLREAAAETSVMPAMPAFLGWDAAA